MFLDVGERKHAIYMLENDFVLYFKDEATRETRFEKAETLLPDSKTIEKFKAKF